jgi:hypothetical protein
MLSYTAEIVITCRRQFCAYALMLALVPSFIPCPCAWPTSASLAWHSCPHWRSAFVSLYLEAGCVYLCCSQCSCLSTLSAACSRPAACSWLDCLDRCNEPRSKCLFGMCWSPACWNLSPRIAVY